MNRRTLSLLTLIALAATFCTAQSQPVDYDKVFASATAHYERGEYRDAAADFKQAVAADSFSPSARAGLIRSLIELDEVDAAVEAAHTSTTSLPLAADVHAAAGEALFRSGDMVNAEKEFQTAIKNDRSVGRAYYGLFRLYQAYSLHRKAFDLLALAHQLAPADAEIQDTWFRFLPPVRQIAHLEKPDTSSLTVSDKEKAELSAENTRTLAAIKAYKENGNFPCTMITKVEKADIHLEPIMYNAKILREWGLRVGVNDHAATLLLDTGAGGIVISRKVAERSGVTELWKTKSWGIGDAGFVDAHMGLAKHITIGGLQFENCLVEVVERANVADEDGLIGGNVFAHFLFDLNYPTETLHLLPLPKDTSRPEVPPSLTVAGHVYPDDPAVQNSEDPKVLRNYFFDRMISPEMESWTRVFREGHQLFVPTFVNHVGPAWFLLDTGASDNMLSERFARAVTKVSVDQFGKLTGLSGEVKKTYSASKAEVQFGNFKTKDVDMLTINLTRFGHGGIENSGFIGFHMLRLLEIKIDYRDGLVDFTFNRDNNFIPNLNNRKDVMDYK